MLEPAVGNARHADTGDKPEVTPVVRIVPAHSVAQGGPGVGRDAAVQRQARFEDFRHRAASVAALGPEPGDDERPSHRRNEETHRCSSGIRTMSFPWGRPGLAPSVVFTQVRPRRGGESAHRMPRPYLDDTAEWQESERDTGQNRGRQAGPLRIDSLAPAERSIIVGTKSSHGGWNVATLIRGIVKRRKRIIRSRPASTRVWRWTIAVAGSIRSLFRPAPGGASMPGL